MLKIPLRVKSLRSLTGAVLGTLLLILTCLQLRYSLTTDDIAMVTASDDKSGSTAKTPVTAGATTDVTASVGLAMSNSHDDYDSDAYYQSKDGFKIILANPEVDGQVYVDRMLSSDDDIHVISDFKADDYYTNKKLNDYTNRDGLDLELNKQSAFKQFVSELLEKVVECRPPIGAINNPGHYNSSNVYKNVQHHKMPVLDGKLRENNGADPIRSKEYLRSYLTLSDEELDFLKGSHHKAMNLLPDGFPSEVSSEIKGRGILYAGGGSYNWLVLLSLVMLRQTGSKLPVEVFIPKDSDYQSDLCNRVFPVFGAKCLLMENYVDVKKYKFKGYQLKSMALLLTSFEEVLLLDSDNIPLKNPDYMFINEPYKSNGMIVWPDFWRRSTSPLYYEIANITVNETHQVRFSYGDERDHPQPLETHEDYEWKISYHDLEGTLPEASSETGQLLINKKTHAKAIFLSLYYNFFGPDYYYGLFSQGQAGEGDKETILAAAHKLGLPYYQVQEYIREFGESTGEYEFHIAAMGQYDPILDYLQGQEPEKYKYDKWVYDRKKNNYPMHKYKESETMFLHCNQPKLYPWQVDGNGFRKIHDTAGNRRRLYSHYLHEELGFDAEAKIWESMQWLLCNHGDISFRGSRDSNKWCAKVTEQLDWLKMHPEDVEIKGEEKSNR